MDEEVWKPVVGYEGFYSVSSLGRIYSERSRRALSPAPQSAGYMHLTLAVQGVQHSVTVHALVAAAFIGPCPTGHEINHIDCDKKNNRADNLEYVTGINNMRHAHRNRLFTSQRVWDDQVTAIRERYRAGETAEAISADYGLSVAGVRNYVRDIRRFHKLTPDDVLAIRRLMAVGDRTQMSVATEFNVVPKTVRDIVLRRSWADI